MRMRRNSQNIEKRGHTAMYLLFMLLKLLWRFNLILYLATLFTCVYICNILLHIKLYCLYTIQVFLRQTLTFTATWILCLYCLHTTFALSPHLLLLFCFCHIIFFEENSRSILKNLRAFIWNDMRFCGNLWT